MLVWAPGPLALRAAGALQSFYYVSGPIAAAMERELVPAAHMGRWIGIGRVAKMLVGAVLVVVAGAIWDRVGPEWVFLTFVMIDLGIRMPLLISMPETLHLRFPPTPIQLTN